MSRQALFLRRARGQAMIFGLLFMACAALIVLLLFNSSLLTITKSQLQNAADAGAYSAALLQARDNNFSAYTNRAMIANQVAVAQFVSLQSYYEDAADTKGRANGFVIEVYSFVPSVTTVWDAAIKLPMDTEYTVVKDLAGPAVKALDLLISAMDEAQNIHHLGTMTEMMLVADDVVKKNDPLAKVTKSVFMVGDGLMKVTHWGNDQTKRFSANDASPEADRFADAVVSRDSEDLFIRNRGSIPTPFWASSVKFYLCPLAEATFTTFAFTHTGGTMLSADKRRWMAIDATTGVGFESCTWLVPCFPFGLCPVTEVLPFLDFSTSGVGGSGGVVAGKGSGYEITGYKNNAFESLLYGGSLIADAVPAWVRYAKGPTANLDSAGGLQDHYRDMAAPLAAGSLPKDQTPELNGGQFPITIEVERTADTIRGSTTLLAASDKLKLADSMKGQTMRALASAHAYFYRPRTDDLSRFTRNGWRRPDSKTEYQNLFSPYWQARLAPTTAVEEAAAAATQ